MSDGASSWLLQRLAGLERRMTELERRLADATQAEPAHRTRAAGITEDWQPRDKDIAWAKEAYPNVNEAAEREHFVDYWRARGETRRDWNAAYRNWIRKAAEFSKAPVAILPGRPQGRTAAIDQANRERRNRVASKLAALRGDAAGDEVPGEGGEGAREIPGRSR